jgi:hypothetical protein
LLRASVAQVPDADFGDETFLEPLRELLAALHDEARLEPVGEWATVARLIASLNKRRRLSALLRDRPEIREQPIVAPVFVLGFPRTGTTLLHNLLASDPRNRAIRLWEMREPFAPDPLPDTWQAATIAATEQLIAAGYRLSPRLAAIHPLRATWPDECSWLFRNGFASLVFAFAYHVPRYRDWLLARDMRPDYAYFRLQLQAILAQRPGAPLVLKDPCHLWHLDALLDSFPDARIIHLHRRVEDVVASFCSLCHALQDGGTRTRPPAEIGEYASTMLERGMQRMLAVRASLPADRIVDVDYRELVRDPIARVSALYQRFDLTLDDPARAGMQTWLAQSRELSGAHHYSLAGYGLDELEIRARFAAYTDRFGAMT